MKQLLATTSTHKSRIIAILIADGLFFMFSDPGRVSFMLMAIGWLLTGLNIYLGCLYGAMLLKRLGLLKKEQRLKTTLLAGFIYLVIILQTIGQLSLRDIAALVPLVIIGYLYFRRSRLVNPAI